MEETDKFRFVCCPGLPTVSGAFQCFFYAFLGRERVSVVPAEEYPDAQYAIDYLQMLLLVCHSHSEPGNLKRLRACLAQGDVQLKKYSRDRNGFKQFFPSQTVFWIILVGFLVFNGFLRPETRPPTLSHIN